MEFSMALLLLAVLNTIEGRDDRGTEESGTVWSKRSADPAAAAASGEPKQLDRLTSGTLADFAEYAISGVPVVVPATASGWPLEGLSCEKISNDFASARMRMEYAHKMPEVGAGSEVGNNGEEGEGGEGEGVANNDGDDGENPQSIGDKSWMSAQIPSGTLVGRVGPKYAPFYWDIKEGDHWVREKIQGNIYYVILLTPLLCSLDGPLILLTVLFRSSVSFPGVGVVPAVPCCSYLLPTYCVNIFSAPSISYGDSLLVKWDGVKWNTSARFYSHPTRLASQCCQL